jgi:fused signal recognition particle receptor
MFRWFKRKDRPEDTPPMRREPGATAADGAVDDDTLSSLQVIITPADVTPPEFVDSLPTTALQPSRLTQYEREDKFGAASAAGPDSLILAPPTLPPAIADLEPHELIELSDEIVNPASRPTTEDIGKAVEQLRQPDREGFFSKLKNGLKRTGNQIAGIFTYAKIDDELYEELESALLMADAGVSATTFLMQDLKRRVKESRATEAEQVRGLLERSIAELLQPLERPLDLGKYTPTVIMTVGVNGAGKTTTIGKLTAHFQTARMKVILAAGDTFRAAAREQLAVWADRNRTTIISRSEADPASVIFDAVQSGVAKQADVVIADTAGRLPTQLHLMEELKKIKRTISKAMDGAPHEVLLVLDGNTGQNALAQVKAFDDALELTGLVVTKLDGTARGGMLCGIARWGLQRGKPLPVYFIGVGEKLEDLQPFEAEVFAKALMG